MENLTHYTNMISVLCVSAKSNYYQIPGLDLYDKRRNCLTFTGTNKVITHAPCQQWSKLRGLAYSSPEKDLANFCMDVVLQNGGIFEHPAGSKFFKYRNIKPTAEVNQSWFGFPARKATWLYFHNCEPAKILIQPVVATRQVNNMNSEQRSIMPLRFCEYLIHCIHSTKPFNV